METHRIDQPSEPERRSTTGQLKPGTNLMNRYLIQEVIGVGGMGSVYRARDLHFPNVVKLVAVKEMINQAPDLIVFRDMNPSIVMVNQHTHIILVDFGIAKSFQTGQKGTMIGTEGYSPPEQYRGEASTSADIYALGATLHHILSRRDPRLEPPFSFPERPLRKINPGVSVELETVINTALQYKPADRFKTSEDFKEALIGAGRNTGLLNRMNTAASATVRNMTGIKPVWAFQCEDEIRGTPLYFNGMLYTGCYDNNLYALNAANCD